MVLVLRCLLRRQLRVTLPVDLNLGSPLRRGSFRRSSCRSDTLLRVGASRVGQVSPFPNFRAHAELDGVSGWRENIKPVSGRLTVRPFTARRNSVIGCGRITPGFLCGMFPVDPTNPQTRDEENYAIPHCQTHLDDNSDPRTILLTEVVTAL